MRAKSPVDEDVHVFIEGLLVQTRTPADVVKWAINYGAAYESERLSKCKIQDNTKPWAYHFDDANGYILIKPTTMNSHGHEIPIISITVSLNETNPNSPTLKVTSLLHQGMFPRAEYVASLVALAKYYAIDGELLGSKDEEKEKAE